LRPGALALGKMCEDSDNGKVKRKGTKAQQKKRNKKFAFPLRPCAIALKYV